MAVKFQRLSSIPLERKNGQDAGARSDWDGSAFSRHRPPAQDGASRAHPEPALLGLDQKAQAHCNNGPTIILHISCRNVSPPVLFSE